MNADMTSPISKLRATTPNAAHSTAVELANRQAKWPVNREQLCAAVRAVLSGENIEWAQISLVVVDDPTIHELNRRFLQHDEPTDVLSFVLEQNTGFVEGEIIISADTAAQAAQRFGWLLENEQLLYVIHGALHLVGYDDQSPTAQQQMRSKERFYLNQFGLNPHYEEPCP